MTMDETAHLRAEVERLTRERDEALAEAERADAAAMNEIAASTQSDTALRAEVERLRRELILAREWKVMMDHTVRWLVRTYCLHCGVEEMENWARRYLAGDPEACTQDAALEAARIASRALTPTAATAAWAVQDAVRSDDDD